MTSLNHEITIFGGMRWNLGIFFALILFGVFFISAECRAQAVPPRGQALQMIRPPAPPPEPPIQKEIRELKQDVRRTKIELERKIEAEKAQSFVAARSSYYERKLAVLLANPFADEGIRDAMKNEKCRVSIAPILKYINKLYLDSLRESGAELRRELQNLLSDPYNHGKIRPLIGQVPHECKGPLYTFLNYMHALAIQIEQDRVRLNKRTQEVNDDHDRCR